MQLVVTETLQIGKILLTKLAYFVGVYLPSVNSFVPLQMPPFSELLRALITLKLGIAMIKFVSDKTTSVTEQFGTFFTLKPDVFMDSLHVSVEVILDVVNNITMRAVEIFHLQYTNAMEFGFMLFSVL